MRYKEILKEIAKKEGVSEIEIEEQMKTAILMTGIKCSPKEFIKVFSKLLTQDYI